MGLRDTVRSMLAPIRFGGGGRPVLHSDVPLADDTTHSDVPYLPPRGVTTNPSDPRLGRGVDDNPTGQNDVYLVLSDEARAMGFVRPVRRTYVHARELGGCGAVTTMGQAIAETYARNPRFYGATYCTGCSMHRPVGADGEFYWDGTTDRVGT